jgi:hypothetical protein
VQPVLLFLGFLWLRNILNIHFALPKETFASVATLLLFLWCHYVNRICCITQGSQAKCCQCCFSLVTFGCTIDIYLIFILLSPRKPKLVEPLTAALPLVALCQQDYSSCVVSPKEAKPSASSAAVPWFPLAPQ